MNEQQRYCEQKLAYEIDSWDLHVGLSEGQAITVVDTRSADSFSADHIPGAINVPHREMTADSTSEVDRSTIVVCYCDGIGCNASTKGALNMLKLGFQVKELIGGIDWWKRDGHPTTACTTEEGSCGCG
jgi:rhodanese-related sulfurtransferase